MKYIALICARGGSKGLPGKNIKRLGDKPLIGWSISVANKIKNITKVIVSTDSDEIAKIAKEQGAEVPFMRPSELAGDSSPEWLVWRHAIEYLRNNNEQEFDGLVVLPATAPLRSTDDVKKCLDKYEESESDIVITVTEAHRNPYFNMVTIDGDGDCGLVISKNDSFTRRQDAPAVYDMTTVAYVANPDFVMGKNGTFEGKVRSVYVPPERALDIDTAFDFKIAECLLNKI